MEGRVLREAFLFFLLSFCHGVSFAVGWESYGDVLQQMKIIKARHPALVEIVSLGENDQGDSIEGLRIQDPQLTDREEIPNLLVGTHHGDERDAAPLSLAFAERVLKILSNHESEAMSWGGRFRRGSYYVFPVLNISGYNHKFRGEQNAQGLWLDSNRDYPDACAKEAPSFRLRSTTLLTEFIDTHQIVSTVSIHGYRHLGAFTYPWGFFTEDPTPPDRDIYHALLTYAAKANHYPVGTHKELVYAASGTFEDWAYHAHGVWTALLEMKYRPDYDADVEALLRFFQGAPEQRSRDHAHYGQCSSLVLALGDGRENESLRI